LSESELEKILSDMPLFSALNQETISGIAAWSGMHSFHSDEFIVHEGEIASNFFLILDGQVEVRRDSKPVARLARGQFFGETTIAEDESRSADVVAIQQTTCLSLTRSQLKEVMEKNPSVAIKLLEEVTKRYGRGAAETEQDVKSSFGTPFHFESESCKKVFESLVDCFVSDYMIKRFVTEKCGWRSVTEISKDSGVSVSLLYGKQGKIGSALEEPVKRGLVETRFFPGERGRGGEVTRFRIQYEKDPVKAYVNQVIRFGRKAPKES
jgi:signal-transduction protein with cAMP-binding, CBS, and nucleotidyltransferase domain